MRFVQSRWALTIVMVALFGTATVNGTPIPSQHGIAISQGSFGGDPATNYFDYSTDNNFSHSASPGVNAYGDLTTAQLGSEDTNPAGGQSIANIFDTLQFSADATVSFSFTLDGRLASSSIFDRPYGQARVSIYDITSLTTPWAETTTFADFTTVSAVSAATGVSIDEIFIRSDYVEVYTDETGRVRTPSAIPLDGAWHEVNHTLTGSFDVQAGNTYGIMSFLNVVGGGTGRADFLNTGTFAFTDLGSATFTSASGVFPGVSVSNVPIPSPFFLIVPGLLALFRGCLETGKAVFSS